MDRSRVALEDLRPGAVFMAPNQGTSITPRVLEVTIVWVGAGTVHYTAAGDPRVRDTPVERFLAILNAGVAQQQVAPRPGSP